MNLKKWAYGVLVIAFMVALGASLYGNRQLSSVNQTTSHLNVVLLFENRALLAECEELQTMLADTSKETQSVAKAPKPPSTDQGPILYEDVVHVPLPDLPQPPLSKEEAAATYDDALKVMIVNDYAVAHGSQQFDNHPDKKIVETVWQGTKRLKESGFAEKADDLHLRLFLYYEHFPSSAIPDVLCIQDMPPYPPD